MPTAWRATLRNRVRKTPGKSLALNTILPLSDLIEAIRHRKTLGQQRSSPLFVARALDPPLFRCPKRASVPRGCEVELEGVALPPIDVFENGLRAAVPLHPQG